MISTYPKSVISIDFAHQKTHEGRYFSGGYNNISVANNGTLDLLVQMGATNLFHMKVKADSGGDVTLQLYEDATFSNAGTGVTMSNHSRSSAKAFDATVTHTPTVTGTGTQVNGTVFIPGGSGGNSQGGGGGWANEYILSASKNYLIRVTNVSGGSKDISLTIEGYQPTL